MVISKKTEPQNAVISFPVTHREKEAIAQLASSDEVNSKEQILNTLQDLAKNLSQIKSG